MGFVRYVYMSCVFLVVNGEDDAVLSASGNLDDFRVFDLLASELEWRLDILFLTVATGQHLAKTPGEDLAILSQSKGVVAADRDGRDSGQSRDKSWVADRLLVAGRILGSGSLGVSQAKLVAV